MTTIVNVKVKYIRPTYNTLQDWMKNPQHEYIGRCGVVFINKERFPKKSSQWAKTRKRMWTTLNRTKKILLKCRIKLKSCKRR